MSTARWTPGFARGPAFDQALLVGAPVLAIGAGVVCSIEPELFAVLLVCDVFLLGYHHVIATFTRTLMDRESFGEHGLYSLALLPVVALGVVALGRGVGWWAVHTVYLYWQWWHYTRQSYGVERIYARSGEVGPISNLTWGMVYAVPAWAFLERCAMGHATSAHFLGEPVAWLPVPMGLAHGIGIAVGILAIAWGIEQYRASRRGPLPVGRMMHLAGHVTVFVTGYVLITDVDHGWLAINIWHNLQYLFVVWLFNSNRFRRGVDPAAPWLSWLSQARNAPVYVLALLGITAVVYGTLSLAIRPFDEGLALAIVVFQTLNFHHYVVDSRIWKMRRKKVRETFAPSRSTETG